MPNDSASPELAIGTKMRFVRAQIGAYTPHGHAISNTIEILEARRTYVRPDWATHETQTLTWRLRWQADHQAALSLPKGDRA